MKNVKKGKKQIIYRLFAGMSVESSIELSFLKKYIEFINGNMDRMTTSNFTTNNLHFIHVGVGRRCLKRSRDPKISLFLKKILKIFNLSPRLETANSLVFGLNRSMRYVEYDDEAKEVK